MKKLVYYIFLLFLIFCLSYLLIHTVRAGLVSDFSLQLSTQVKSSAANHTLTFTTSSDFGPNETLEIYFEPDFDLSLIGYNDIDFMDDSVDLDLAAAPGTGASSEMGVGISGQVITFTQNDTDTIASGSDITIAIGQNADHQVQGSDQIYNPTTADTYKISISGNFGDLGTISVQILETDSVALEATVTPELSFSLRNAADNNSPEACSLGAPDTDDVNTCQYRLAVETNAQEGFSVFIRSDGDLRNTFDSISNIVEGWTISAGTEGYGIAVTAGTGIDEQGIFDSDDSPISATDSLLIKTDSVYNYTQGDLDTSSLITHKIAISEETPAGFYSQIIIYTIIGNY